MEKKFTQDFICKIQNKINKYLGEKYVNIEKIKYNTKERKKYLEKLDQCLVDEEDWHYCCFIMPNGKMKKLTFDLSDFDFSFIDNNVLLDKIKIEHKNIIYKGFSLEDIINAGCVRIGYVEWQSELYIEYSSFYKIPEKIFNIIENALYQNNTIYITDVLTGEYDSFSNINGNTIKDIKRSFNKRFNR